MTRATRFDPSTHAVALSRELAAMLVAEVPDPPIPITGVTIGVATMDHNAPHAGERHSDGDEVLYLITGRVLVTVESEPVEKIEMLPGDGVIVPRGIWHTVDVIEPSKIMYVTPGPNNQFRGLTDEA